MFDGEHVEISEPLRQRLDELQKLFATSSSQEQARYYEVVHALVALETLATEPGIVGRQNLIEVTAQQARDAGCTIDDINLALHRRSD
ncbi:MAG TPA: hypothetical protein VK501_23895 [Baekduia sp.]|uniref:hypothetical protein n=1 Tax=Baekduia sp. TaxID=2600305 RepID=UPI002CD15D7A|nr:hypothetical protein [Baekduia sp.]HMJ36970.1 hypothetical protein [Baekduia sp.]